MAVGSAGAISAAAGILGSAGAQRAAAKLITSPKFVEWLTTPVSNPQGIGAHFGRLTAITAEDPTLKEPVEAFIKALRSPPQDQGATE